MNGWKIVWRMSDMVFISRYARLRENALYYSLGIETARPEMPMFFFSTGVSGAYLAEWGRSTYPVALLYVHAQEPCLGMERIAQNEQEFASFWLETHAGREWPSEKSYKAPLHTFASALLMPVALAWEGILRPEKGPEIQQAMDAVAGTPRPTIDVFFPIAR